MQTDLMSCLKMGDLSGTPLKTFVHSLTFISAFQWGVTEPWVMKLIENMVYSGLWYQCMQCKKNKVLYLFDPLTQLSIHVLQQYILIIHL